MRPILFAAAPLVAAPLVAALLVAALLATAPAPAWAETLLHLSEAAQIQVHPDRLAAGLRVEADGATTTEVQAKVNAGMAAALDLAKKTAGITASTGPPAASMMRLVTPSPEPSTTLCAPAFSAACRFSSLISTEMMFWCFSARSTLIAFRPRPPAPTSTIASFGGIGMAFLIAA